MALISDPKDAGYRPVTLEACDLVFGDRNASYGHPLDDFSCTATMMTAYLRHRGLLQEDAEIEAEDIGPLMICVKLSRQANAPKRDSMVDVAGYAETTERVIFERARRDKADLEALEIRLFGDLDEDEDDAFSCTTEEVDLDETGRCGDDDCELCYDVDRLHQAVVNAQAAGVLSPLQRQVNEEIRAHQAAQAEKQQPFVPTPNEDKLRRQLGLSVADLRPIPEPEYETSDMQALFRDLIALCMLPGDLIWGR